MKNYLILCFIICFNTTFAQDYSNFIKSLDTILPINLHEKNVPGMAIAIIDDGQIIYEKGIGLADVDLQTKINSKTGFNIGSISKMFTAWGVMKLVEKEIIDLDTPVEAYLTRWQLPKSEFDSKKVTVRALLSHTAGISVHGYPGFHPNAKLPSLEASLDGDNGPVRANEKVEISIEPQTKFQYSGGGYTILQLLIEEVTGKSFETYMTQEIFKPLKMKHTSFSIDNTYLKTSATPYDENGEAVYIERFTAKAAAGLHTNLDDLIVFAKATLNENTVLSKSTIEYQVYFLGPITVKGHAGSNTGWESGFMLDIEHKSGIIMLTNSSNGKDVAINTLRKWVKWKASHLKPQD